MKEFWTKTFFSENYLELFSVQELILFNSYLFRFAIRPSSPLYFTNKHCSAYCAGIWLFCTLLAATPYAGWGRGGYINESVMCSIDYTASISYTLFLYIGAEGTSIGVTVISYTKLFLKLNESSKRMGDNLSAESKAKRNQAICSMMLSAVFTAAWTPYCIQCFCDIYYDVIPWMIKYSTYLGVSNSSINGFLYIFINRNYRDTFLGLFKRNTIVHPLHSVANTMNTTVHVSTK